MKSVGTVKPTVLFHFYALALSVFVLGGDVITALADLTGQSHLRSLITRHRRRLSSIELLEDLDDSTRTHGATTLTDGEAETFLHGDWSNQLHRHFGVVSRHDHFGALGQLN